MAAIESAAATPASGARFDIGRVVGATLRIVRARFWTLLLLGLPWVIVPQLIAAAIPNLPFAVSALFGLPGLVFELAATVAGYNVLVGGPKLGFSALNSRALSRFGSLFAARFVANLATGLGLLALIVPGVILLAAWMASTPAVVIENRPAIEALDRSWKLTRGSRWRLAGLMGLGLAGLAVLFAGAMVVVFLVSFVAGLFVGATGAVLGDDASAAIGAMVAAPLITFPFLMFQAAGWTAAYVELRSLREGPLDEQIAETFA